MISELYQYSIMPEYYRNFPDIIRGIVCCLQESITADSPHFPKFEIRATCEHPVSVFLCISGKNSEELLGLTENIFWKTVKTLKTFFIPHYLKAHIFSAHFTTDLHMNSYFCQILIIIIMTLS